MEAGFAEVDTHELKTRTVFGKTGIHFWGANALYAEAWFTPFVLKMRPHQLHSVCGIIVVALSLTTITCHGQMGYGPPFGTYRGSFIRTQLSNPVWYEAVEAKDCEDVPEQVNAGKPPRDLCKDATVDTKVCICVKRPGFNVYEPICGQCRDPCALKFVADQYSSSKYQRLTSDESEET